MPSISFSLRTLIIMMSLPLSTSAIAGEVTWEEQAERLQNVNAALLDGLPAAEPVRSALGVELKSVVSFLPAVNPKVGAKKEDVPSAPAHLVPTVQVNGQWAMVGYQVWAGYLIPGAESLLGLDASLSQYILGAAAQPEFDLGGGYEIYLPVGFQISHAEVTGNITEEDSDDEFVVDNQFYFGGVGARSEQLGTWVNLIAGTRQNKSEFSIEVDNTSLSLEDSPAAFQLAAGWQGENLQVGLAQLYIPERVTMPRLLLGYEFQL